MMASTAEDDERDAAVYDEDDDDDSDDGVDSNEEYDDEVVADGHLAALPPPAPPAAATDQRILRFSSSSSVSNPNANPSASSPIPQNGAGGGGWGVASSDGKRQRISPRGGKRKLPAVACDESRRVFQKLWTDADEITILQGFLEFTSQRGTTHTNYQHDTAPFYDQIKNRLQLDFNKNQLVEKLRRLKKKYRNMGTRIAAGKEFVFKSPHDKAIFEIARKIWARNAPNPQFQERSNLVPVEVAEDIALSSDQMMSRSRRKGSEREVAVGTPVVSIPVVQQMLCASAPIPNASLIEQTVKSCLSPMFKELLQHAVGGPCGLGGAGDGGAALNLSGADGTGAVQVDEKWRKLQILELEVYLKRVELVHQQVKSKLEELRSMGSS